MRTWTALTVTAAAELEDVLGSFLLDQGAPGLQAVDNGSSVRITAHFAGHAPIEEVERFCAALPELFPGVGRPRVSTAEVRDEGWADNWKDHFPPLEIGRRLYVHPPWVESVPPGRVGIEIDPGMAFGTGHHPSTRGCLRAMERACETMVFSRVLDLGTGSGILAVAAARLGAGEVLAIDIDPEACRIAVENAERNGVGQVVRVAPSLAAARGRFDLVLANLFAHDLVELAGTIASLLLPGGLAVGAGLLASEAPPVRRAWEEAGLAPEWEHAEEGWLTLAWRRGTSKETPPCAPGAVRQAPRRARRSK